ncbi:MAG: radical SAM/SPASM domain-containing protein [Chloroflexota bacterium]
MKLPPFSNLGNFFPKLLPQAGKPPAGSRPFRVAQIEVTSRCSTGCVFCPHDALSGRWVEGDLPLELYRDAIAPHLGLFELVYLQGWGEPMLHPDLWEMLGLAQDKGCRTGFTTNGSWLEDEQNRRLLDLGVNLISVSFAGTAAPIHESLRTNSEFSKLCRNFERLAALKKRRGTDKPWLELHFLMTRANLDEFPALVELAASLGADEMVATNLTYAPSPALDRMRVFGEQPRNEDVAILVQARQNAERLDLPLRVYPLQTEPRTLVCDADPLNTVYINHRGEVSPCVYLGLTVQGRIPRFYHGEAQPFDTISFGNVSGSLEQVLSGKARQAFTSAFERRNVSSSPLAIFTYMAGRDETAELPPPPVPCRHCYKMLGI